MTGFEKAWATKMGQRVCTECDGSGRVMSMFFAQDRGTWPCETCRKAAEAPAPEEAPAFATDLGEGEG